ncbi:MAG: HAMP domain-containing histidine kinase, partial [Treponemataceae bacterium]|nr:HAMP domain-containing histidine kinase [Treponemataceae bacterium]
MTIKHQLRIFIAVIIGFPVLCISLARLHSHLSSSDRILMRGYNKLLKMEGLALTEKEWETIYNAIRTLPPNTEAALIAQDTVIVSTMPDLKERTEVGEQTLWEIIKNTGDKYYYQFETPPIGGAENNISLITRMNKVKNKRIKKFYRGFFLLMVSFITICIVIVYLISNSIFTSLNTLERQTKKIADGTLDETLVPAKNSGKQNEITHLIDNLEQMRCSMLEAKNRKSRFIMGISHDLRTPIAVIKGYTEAISDGMMTSQNEINSALQIINAKTTLLESMINTLINYEKMESNDWSDKLAPVKLHPLLLEFARNAAATGELFRRRVAYSVQISETAEIPMNVQLMQRALENLFNNALRYTDEDDCITISAEEAHGAIQISIADTGIGIDGKDVPHIFDLLYRGTNSRREEGMGIGLSVVKNVMDIHGWSISVASEKG